METAARRLRRAPGRAIMQSSPLILDNPNDTAGPRNSTRAGNVTRNLSEIPTSPKT